MTHTIDPTKGELNSTVSRQWANRSDDQRFTSLSALYTQVDTWAENTEKQAFVSRDFRATYDREQPEYLGFTIGNETVEASHWGLETVARLAGAPPNYLRTLPGPLAAANLNYGLATQQGRDMIAHVSAETGLRGITSAKYGQILDRDVVAAVMKVAGNGTGDTRWKVPGTIDWGGKHGISYNPEVEITKQNTTLYASDRDVFMFLVDDMNPIEVGKLDNGDPDLMFRGFYVWNSEVGCRTFGFASMYLRGVCQNRNLWGVENFKEVTFKHTSGAPEKFLTEATPALVGFAEGDSTRLVEGVKAAKAAIVAKTDEERIEFMARFGISAKMTRTIEAVALAEEGHPPSSIWDFAQGVTAIARRETLQEERLRLETIGGRILDRVKLPA